jgi:hypothetical protein
VIEMLESWDMQRAPEPGAVPDSIFAPLGDTAPGELTTTDGRRVH